jgi:hypothetical protein
LAVINFIKIHLMPGLNVDHMNCGNTKNSLHMKIAQNSSAIFTVQ